MKSISKNKALDQAATKTLSRPLILATLLILLLSSCASAPKNAATDRQCGTFCTKLDACLGDRYDDALKDRLCEVARCESGCRANAKSPAGYVGAFQFARVTWASVCGPIFRKMNLDHCTPVEARSDLCCAAACTAEMFARGDHGHWPQCGR